MKKICFSISTLLAVHFALGDKALAQIATSSPASGFTRSPASVDPAKLGWNKRASAGGNLAFASSKSVVGQTDGSSETYGLNAQIEFVRFGPRDEWKNSLSVTQATSRTPALAGFVKANDELRLQSAYLLSFFDEGSDDPRADPSFGPYARVEAVAPIFAGQDVRASSQTYRVARGDSASEIVNGTSLKLTDGFRPLTTKESTGVFWRPHQGERFKLEARLGAAALQVLADGQLAIRGTNAAGEIEVIQLSNVSQAGFEAALGFSGAIDEKSKFEGGLEVLAPLYVRRAAGDVRSALELTNLDAFVKLSSSITDWAFFAYDYRLKIQPQLVSAAQQIHLITLNAKHDWWGY